MKALDEKAIFDIKFDICNFRFASLKKGIYPMQYTISNLRNVTTNRFEKKQAVSLV